MHDAGDNVDDEDADNGDDEDNGDDAEDDGPPEEQHSDRMNMTFEMMGYSLPTQKGTK